MEIKYKRNFEGGMLAAGISSAATNLVGAGIGIAEWAGAKKNINRLRKEKPQLDVPSELYKGYNTIEQTRDFGNKVGERNMSSATGAITRDSRNAGLAIEAMNRSNDFIQNTNLNAGLQELQLNKQIADEKVQNQRINFEAWMQEMNTQQERRSAGIESFHGSLQEAGAAVPFMMGYNPNATTKTAGNYTGGRIKGEWGGKEKEERSPLFIVNTKGEQMKNGEGRTMTITHGEIAMPPDMFELSIAAANGNAEARAKYLELANSKRFKTS